MYLVFDLETSGLPIMVSFNKYYNYDDNSKYDSSRIVQVAWQIIGSCPEFKEGPVNSYIIKRDGFNIRNSEFHGITNNMSDNGTAFKEVMVHFFRDLEKCSYIVAHNLLFDYNVLLNHLHRYKMHDQIKILQNKKQYCTMINSMPILKIPRKYGGGFKATSLNEVYNYYFNKDVDNAHDAYYDVKACSECLLMLLKEHT